MAMEFKRASRTQAKLRLALEGASGSGKTTAALRLAKAIGGRIALIDTEHGSASLYADVAEFDVLELSAPFSPERYVEAIKTAESAGYDVIIIDSITHEWNGAGGILELKDKMGGRFQDWAKLTPRHDQFVQAILRARAHMITCCRSKQGYQYDEHSKKVTKVGMEAQQRDGLDFEMTVVWQLTAGHIAQAMKDRTRLFDGRDGEITEDTGCKLIEWLSAAPMPPPPPLVPPSEVGKWSEDQKKEATGFVKAIEAHGAAAKTEVEKLRRDTASAAPAEAIDALAALLRKWDDIADEAANSEGRR